EPIGNGEVLQGHGELRCRVVDVELEVGVDVEHSVQAAAADSHGTSARVGDHQVAAGGEDVEVAGLILVLAHPSQVRAADLVHAWSHQVNDVGGRRDVVKGDGGP